VILRRIVLRGFRNLEDGELELPAEGVALVGPNAQGKSNFLEAVHYLELFRSFRGTRDTRLIRFGEDFFRLEGFLEPGPPDPAAPGAEADAPSPPLSVAAAVQRAGSEKRVTVGGQAPDRIGDALGHVGSVLFTPDDVRLVSDGPQERRRFLDIVLSVNAPGYLPAIQRYRQVLAQRNAALRDRAPVAAVQAWDALLARSGGEVMAHRSRWIEAGSGTFAAVVREVSGGEEGRIRYAPGVPDAPSSSSPGADADTWSEALARALAAGLDEDRRRGTTRAGPHRDEFRMGVEPSGGTSAPGGERDLREYGSGGQKRTAALALRILEGETILRRRGRPPLLLLDDVFAELDRERSERVMGLLERTAAGQVILTAPKDADVRFRKDRLPRWRILAGRIDAGGEG
jgi:DNA replication and repair protein RecF